MADRNSFETEHAWVEERLSEYIDNRLSPLEHAQLERHVRGCARCQASLASLKWTVSLVKQAPAPALPRQFTLPLPAQPRRAPAYGFGFARLGTVVATLLLFAVVGVDLISRLGGGFAASAPAPAALREAKPSSIALAPTEPANAAQPAAPTAAPMLQSIPTAAPAPTLAALPPAPAAAPPVASTEVFGRGGAPGETSAADGVSKSAAATPTPLRSQAPARAPSTSATPTATPMTTLPALSAASIPTATAIPPTATPQPTATATAVPPTATLPRPSPTPVVQARVQPTVAPQPSRLGEAPAPVVEPLRVAEIALFFFAVFFGVLTVMLRRR